MINKGHLMCPLFVMAGGPLPPVPAAALCKLGDQRLAGIHLGGAANDFTTRGAGDGVAATQGGERAHPVEASAEHGEAVVGQIPAFGDEGMEALLGQLVATLAGSQQALRALALQAQLQVGEAPLP